ncbi:MAG: MAPEG family protein [bacterium]|nr:MAPEG family protein [bacterium]
MSASSVALLGYAAWTLILVGGIAAIRSALTLGGNRLANSFQPDGSDVSEFSQRLCRAHANCYENLPAFAAIILVALVAGRSEITDGLALWVLAARVAQSMVHLASTSPPAVTVRFGLFFAQWAVQLLWAVRLLGS